VRSYVDLVRGEQRLAVLSPPAWRAKVKAREGRLLSYVGADDAASVWSACWATLYWGAWRCSRSRWVRRAADGLLGGRSVGVGRRKGGWWKWKVEPFTLDAVLIYAQRGHGRRASLYTDYTFGVWKDGELVPFAKAYSGLTDAEIRKVDAFVRRNTLQRFGPVRTVKPELVFELAFEGIQRSPRHKSGVAVRFPRMLRWRTDKKPEDADSLETIVGMLEAEGR
jgi:DNA ligase 1